jgi:hypothetical protein
MISFLLLLVLLQPKLASSVLRPSSMTLLRIHVEITQEMDKPLDKDCLTKYNNKDTWSIVVFDSLTEHEDKITSPIVHRKTLQLTEQIDNSIARHAILHLPISRPSCFNTRDQSNLLLQNTPTQPINCEQVIVVALSKTTTISDLQNVTQVVKRIVHTISYDASASLSSASSQPSYLEPIRIDLHHSETKPYDEDHISCTKKEKVYSWYTLIPIHLSVGLFFILYRYFWNQSHLDWIADKDLCGTFIQYIHESLMRFRQSNNDDSSFTNEELSVTSYTSYNQPMNYSRPCRSCHESRADSWMNRSDWKRPIEHEHDSDDENSIAGNTILRAPSTIRKYWRRTIEYDFDDEDRNRRLKHQSCDLLFERGSMMNYRELPWSNPIDKRLLEGTANHVPVVDSILIAATKENSLLHTEQIEGESVNEYACNTETVRVEAEKRVENGNHQDDASQTNIDTRTKRKGSSECIRDETTTNYIQNVTASKQVQWSDDMSYSGEHDLNKISMLLESTSNNSGESQGFNDDVLTTDPKSTKSVSRYGYHISNEENKNTHEKKPTSVVFDLMLADSYSDDAHSSSAYCKSQELPPEPHESNNQNGTVQITKEMKSKDWIERSLANESGASKKNNQYDRTCNDSLSQRNRDDNGHSDLEDVFKFENDSVSIESQNETVKISPIKQKKVFNPPSVRPFKPSAGLFHASLTFSAPVWEHSVSSNQDTATCEEGVAKTEHLQQQVSHFKHDKNSSKSSNKTTSDISESKSNKTSALLKKKSSYAPIHKKRRNRRQGSIPHDKVPTIIDINVCDVNDTSLSRHQSAKLKRKRRTEDGRSDTSETSSKRSRAY